MPWTPPLGIPAPDFGITEAAPALPDPWTEHVANFYYVDFVTGDDANTPGNPTAPRKTIPLALASSGTPIVVVVAAATYTQSHVSPNELNWTGTAEAPIYLRGVSDAERAVFDTTLELDVSAYVIVEYVDWVQTGTAKRAVTVYTLLGETHHIAVRHGDMAGNETGTSASAGFAVSAFHATHAPHDVVLWDVVVHHFGDPAAEGDPDFHGLAVSNGSGGAGVHHIWFVDCEMHHNQGDGCQLTNATLADQAKMHHFYVGRCVSHENRQSGIWSKSTVDTIFSQNICWGHRPVASASGAGMGAQYGPERLWFLFNHCYDNEVGIALSSDSGLGAGTATYLIGNLIHDCGPLAPAYDADDSFVQVGGINLYTSAAIRYLVNNTIWNTSRGVATSTTTGAVHLVNNIIGPPTYAGDYTILYADGTVAAASDMTNNLLGATERIGWAHASETLAAFQARTSKGQDSLVASPGFMDATDDFRLAQGSAALDVGLEHAAYAAFVAAYGISIARDLLGAPRPQGAAFDLGAYERDGRKAVLGAALVSV